MQIRVHNRIAEIDASQWNAMLSEDYPFLRHEFLQGLEQCQCVCQATGWQPAHIAIYSSENERTLVGAMPCYIKQHSYGEYIFDWAWADAYQRHGLEYYPKLNNAVPFTPATGPRWLVNAKADYEQVSSALIQHALTIVKEKKLSSFHCLFPTARQLKTLQGEGLSGRYSSQFHWHNKAYTSFAHFLDQMSSKKRKNIKRERRRVQEMGVTYRWLSGDQLKPDDAQKMFQFYSLTINAYSAHSYLNADFFDYLVASFASQTLFLFAQYKGQTIAGGLYFKSQNTLYGRYWGALDNFHSVHFETCYYQAIDWCIKNNYRSFEAGAQGQHKLARGLEPSPTYSAHWIRDPHFRKAIESFLQDEQQSVEQHMQILDQHSPFKTTRQSDD